MIIVYILFSLIALAAALGIIYVVNYNVLQSKKLRADEAESIIDETLRNRYDTILRIYNIIKSTVEIEVDFLKEFENLKNKKISNFDLDRKIVEAINLIIKVRDDYKELNENRGFQDCLKDLKDTDEKLTAAKAFYNKHTADLNLIVRKFPSLFVARIHGFTTKAFFDGKNLDDDIINDFKL